MSEVTLYLGDCLEVMPTLPQVDAIITDLPYGTTACSWDEVIPFEPMWAQVRRICKGAFVTTASQPFTTSLIASNRDWFRYELIWDKDKPHGSLMANKRPLKQHENICVFSNKGHQYNPQMRNAQPDRIRPLSRGNIDGCINNVTGKLDNKTSANYDPNRRYPGSIIKISSAYKECNALNRTHPTQKPVALYEYLIRTYTNEGDTVLDICAGSGTTGVACVNTNRNFIGIELREDYYKVMESRIEQAQQQMRLPI